MSFHLKGFMGLQASDGVCWILSIAIRRLHPFGHPISQMDVHLLCCILKSSNHWIRCGKTPFRLCPDNKACRKVPVVIFTSLDSPALGLIQFPHSSMFVRIDSCGTINQLQELKPLTLVPTIQSDSQDDCVFELERIEGINIGQIFRRAGKDFFVIDVYLRDPVPRATSCANRSNLPPPSADSFSIALKSDRKPDITIEKRYNEFTDLRGAVYKHAFEGHETRRCAFCERVVQFIAICKSQPTTGAKLLSSKASLAKRLTTFMRETLALVMTVPSTCGRCAGQKEIPRTLCEFLLPSQRLQEPQEPQQSEKPQEPIEDVTISCNSCEL